MCYRGEYNPFEPASSGYMRSMGALRRIRKQLQRFWELRKPEDNELNWARGTLIEIDEILREVGI